MTSADRPPATALTQSGHRCFVPPIAHWLHTDWVCDHDGTMHCSWSDFT